MKTITADQYYISILTAIAYGFRLGKSIEEILADVNDAPFYLQNPIENN